MNTLTTIAVAYTLSSGICITCDAFQPLSCINRSRIRHVHYQSNPQQFPKLHDASNSIEIESSDSSKLSSSNIEFNSLMVMDVVLFHRKTSSPQSKLELGAVQENGNVAPLSTWTLESAYETPANDMMEFVVDEEDLFPGLPADECTVLMVLDGSVMGYGSRQVGGGKGPGNPHGEESEMLYYVDRGVVEGMYEGDGGSSGDGEGGEMKIDVVVNPNLEHIW